MIYRIFVLLALLSCIGCSSSPTKGNNDEPKGSDTKNKKVPKEKKPKTPFQYRETLVKGSDTAIIKIVAKRQMKIEDVLVELKQQVTIEIEGGSKPACVAEFLMRLIYS